MTVTAIFDQMVSALLDKGNANSLEKERLAALLIPRLRLNTYTANLATPHALLVKREEQPVTT